LTQEIIEDMFKRAIAESLEVPLANVVELVASEIVQGARRLSVVQAKRYTVSYEVVVPSTMSIDALIEKANRIAGSGSVESQIFRQVLTATDGVEQVSQVVIKVLAQASRIEEIMAMSVDKTPTQTDEDKNWTALIIGAIAIVLAVTCLASSAVFLMRRRNADSKSTGNDGSSNFELTL
jgi:SpoVK/Ycf46/Vps4 family AAA+-type ATPase